MFSQLACAIAALAFLSGCTATPVDLRYRGDATGSTRQYRADVDLTAVNDYRTQPPNWLGAIRGGFGNPIKTLETPIPVKEVVRNAYADALRARGLLTPPGTGRFTMEIAIRRMDCSQLVRREAHAHFHVVIVDRQNSRRVFDRNINVDRVSGGVLAADVGVFGTVEDLRRLANETMQAAVDQTLDDPSLLAIVSGG